MSQPQRSCGEMNQMRTPEEKDRESDQKETEEVAWEPERTKPTNNN